MKKLSLVASALFALFALGAIMATAAFAEELPQWLVGGAVIALGSSVTVDIEHSETEAGSLLLEDMHQAVAGETRPDILCEVVKSLGLLLPNGEGEVNSGECVKAEDMNKLCASGSVSVKPAHLPWKTVLVENAGGEFENDPVSGTGGNPGWEATCTDVITVKDVCTTNAGKTLLKNTLDGLVEVEFMETVAAPEEAECSENGGTVHKEGLVAGILFVHALDSTGALLTLAVSLAPEEI